MKPKESEILIVGAGPTGLTLALALAQRGIIPRIIDKHPVPIATSNALAIQPYTLELWKELNLIDDALAIGYPLQGATFSTSSKLLGQISLRDLPTNYPFILALPQSKTEQLLTQHLSKQGVEIERGICLKNLTEQDNSIEALCNDETSSYSWIIGCDGANSTVRELAKIPFKGKNLPQHFIMADIDIDWPLSTNWAHIILSGEGPIAFFPLNDRGFGRLIIEVTGDKQFEQGVQPSLEDFQKLMNERSGLNSTLSAPSWVSSFWIQSRIAESYRKGRLFLAGDAAHRHSPFGGQGLNTGVQDAYYLAMLLAGVIQDGKSCLLNHYEKIRRPIGEQIVHRTSLMTQIVTSKSKPVQSLRNFMIFLLLKFEPVKRKIAMTLSQLIYK